MFGKLTQKLRYIAAPAVVAMAGFFATAEQAEAAKIDTDKGTITVQSGDSLSKIVRKLAKLDIQTTPEKIQAANADLIKDADKIYVGQVFAIPKAEEKSFGNNDAIHIRSPKPYKTFRSTSPGLRLEKPSTLE